ncbi:MAG TPA: NADH-quinone oxidoreductase subunit N [Phycisphaerae bacterium]|nr:NADH-quinone oxidoreductase subunit N [Phycisphaerae bacterium]
MELNIVHLIPEIILLVTACLVCLLGLSSSDLVRRSCQVLAAIACLLGLGVTIATHYIAVNNGTLQSTQAALVNFRYYNPQFITGLACAIGFIMVLISWDMPARSDPTSTDTRYRGEYFGMMLFSLAGVAMIGKVNDLVWLFIVLELVSIPTYIMVATGRSQIIAQEAGIKYFFLGALAAAIFLFGFSYIYGATGATRFADIREALGGSQMAALNNPLALIGILAVIVGVSFKIAAVPMHFYTPDVYQGAATPVTAYLAFAPKTAGIIAIIAMLSLFNFNYSTPEGYSVMILLSVMAGLTMTIGNVLALLQRNIKRTLAYSSIAHSGYMLVGLAAGPGLVGSTGEVGHDGVLATLFYLGSYAVMNTGAFAVLAYLQGKADAGEDLDDLAGVAREHRGPALMFALCLFSLIGMPLTVGFVGKLYIVNTALSSGRMALAIIVAVNAAIAAAYYLKIIGSMYLREPLYPFSLRRTPAIRAAAIICTVGTIALFFVPTILMLPSWGYNAHDSASAAPLIQPQNASRLGAVTTPASANLRMAIMQSAGSSAPADGLRNTQFVR